MLMEVPVGFLFLFFLFFFLIHITILELHRGRKLHLAAIKRKPVAAMHSNTNHDSTLVESSQSPEDWPPPSVQLCFSEKLWLNFVGWNFPCILTGFRVPVSSHQPLYTSQNLLPWAHVCSERPRCKKKKPKKKHWHRQRHQILKQLWGWTILMQDF